MQWLRLPRVVAKVSASCDGLTWRGASKNRRREHKSFEKAKTVGGEDARGERLKAARRAVDGEHGAFAEKGVDAHGE
jgi:hypothetical protein